MSAGLIVRIVMGKPVTTRPDGDGQDLAKNSSSQRLCSEPLLSPATTRPSPRHGYRGRHRRGWGWGWRCRRCSPARLVTFRSVARRLLWRPVKTTPAPCLAMEQCVVGVRTYLASSATGIQPTLAIPNVPIPLAMFSSVAQRLLWRLVTNIPAPCWVRVLCGVGVVPFPVNWVMAIQTILAMMNSPTLLATCPSDSWESWSCSDLCGRSGSSRRSGRRPHGRRRRTLASSDGDRGRASIRSV